MVCKTVMGKWKAIEYRDNFAYDPFLPKEINESLGVTQVPLTTVFFVLYSEILTKSSAKALAVRQRMPVVLFKITEELASNHHWGQFFSIM